MRKQSPSKKRGGAFISSHKLHRCPGGLPVVRVRVGSELNRLPSGESVQGLLNTAVSRGHNSL